MNGNGKHKNDAVVSRKEFDQLKEHFKAIAQMTIQAHEIIDIQIGEIIKLKIAAANAGWPISDAKECADALKRRAEGKAIVESQLQRLRKTLGLE